MFVDERLFRTPRWYLDPPEDAELLLPQELFNGVVLIGQERGDEVKWGGTGFFVRMDTGPDRWHVYLVTAGHCVAGQKNLRARIHQADGPPRVVHLPDADSDRWLRPADIAEGEDRVDLAAIRLPNEDVLDAFAAGHQWIPYSMFFDESLLGYNPMEGVGLGDEVVAVGCFPFHTGTHKNDLIVRIGNLALVPSEPIEVDYGNDEVYRMRLYLTELRSIGGLSGSPVFVPHRVGLGAPKRSMSLLGVMIGHWNDPDRNHVGFGKVVPADLLMKLLEGDAAVAQRKRADKQSDTSEGTAVTDSATDDEFARFEEMTRRLVNVPKEEIDELRKP